MGDLCRPHNYAKPHQVAAAARTMGVEGILVPSCTEFAGGNLVVFPDLLDTHSTIEVVRSEDPTLFINESSPISPDLQSSFVSCHLTLKTRYTYSPARSLSIASWEALWPGAPITQPPGQAPEPQR